MNEHWSKWKTPKDAQQAKYFGAEGIGLFRTQHRFFYLKELFQSSGWVIALLNSRFRRNI